LILQSITVGGWRCFASTVRVGPLSEGINVVHGPNGTGKSTLFEAMARGLLDDHRVSGKEPEVLRSWGRFLPPSVCVEFLHQGAAYRLTKRFLDEPTAKLERRENGKFRPLAEGEAAVRQARSILAAAAPGRGLSQLRNWGLAQVLWAAQGSLAIGQLSEDVVSELQGRLGGVEAAVSRAAERDGGLVERRIEELYDAAFTAKGKLREGKDAPRLVQLRRELESAETRERETLDAQARYEDSVRRLQDFRALRDQAGRDADAGREAFSRAQARSQERARLLQARSEAATRLELERRKHDELSQRVAELSTIRAGLKAGESRLAELENDTLPAQRDLEERTRDEARLKAAREDAWRERLAAEEALRLANEARMLGAARARLPRVEARLQSVADASARCEKARDELAAFLAPDAEALSAVRAAARELEDASVRLESAMITIEIVPEHAGSADVIEGEERGPRQIAAGAPAQFHGSPRVVVSVAGFGRVRAWGPEGSAQELRARKEAAARRLADLTRPYGGVGPDELQSLHDRRAQLLAKRDEAEAALRSSLAGQSLADFESERHQLRLEIDACLTAHPDWTDAPPDGDALASSASSRLSAAAAEVGQLDAAWQAAFAALSKSHQRQDDLAARSTAERRDIEKASERIAVIEADGRSDEDRRRELTSLAIAAQAAVGAFEAIEAKLADFPEDVDRDLALQSTALARHEEEIQRAREAENKEAGRLQALAEQGTYSALSAAQEEKAALLPRLEREELRLAAVRLLRDTVRAARDEARAVIAGPVERTASGILERVAGRRLGRIGFSSAFQPDHVAPELAGGAVELERVSGGEREQAHLAARIALATFLAREERQLLVLDDVLIATDAARLTRMLGVLEEAAQRLQVLVFTCHPERYRALTQATFFDLAELADAAASS